MDASQNPFRSRCMEALSFCSDETTPASLLDKLHAAGGRGSLVGPKGSGKTTLLLELQHLLERRGVPCLMVRLSADGSPLRVLPAIRNSPTAALLLDGAEQLSIPLWWFVRIQSRRRPYVITTSHKRPHLPLLHRHTTTPQLLQKLVAELTDAPISATHLNHLFTLHNGNIRNCLANLYDHMQVLPESENVETASPQRGLSQHSCSVGCLSPVSSDQPA